TMRPPAHLSSGVALPPSASSFPPPARALARSLTPPAPALAQAPPSSAPSIDFDRLAERIVAALQLEKGERVVVRFDPAYFSELVGPLKKRLRNGSPVVLGPLEYQHGPRFDVRNHDDLEKLLRHADVYLWLPVRRGEVSTAERVALQRWLDQGGRRREIHFHWSAGSVLADASPGEHSPDLDAMYQDALDVDYAALSAAQDRPIVLLRSGTVRVRPPAGTDLSFRAGDRPFNKQDGNASAGRARAARVRVDREIELPAGVLRVAPLE